MDDDDDDKQWDNKTLIEKWWHNFRLGLFGVLYLLAKDSTMSTTVGVLSTVVVN